MIRILIIAVLLIFHIQIETVRSFKSTPILFQRKIQLYALPKISTVTRTAKRNVKVTYSLLSDSVASVPIRPIDQYNPWNLSLDVWNLIIIFVLSHASNSSLTDYNTIYFLSSHCQLLFVLALLALESSSEVFVRLPQQMIYGSTPQFISARKPEQVIILYFSSHFISPL